GKNARCTKKYFQFDEYETTFKKEIIAGTTNFFNYGLYFRGEYYNIKFSWYGFQFCFFWQQQFHQQ
ncbi:xanthine/uracil permease, partial [Fusobacterium animalis ATCC 51191]